jgi:hypothetical protein
LSQFLHGTQPFKKCIQTIYRDTSVAQLWLF